MSCSRQTIRAELVKLIFRLQRLLYQELCCSLTEMELTGTDLMVLFYLKQEANYRITDLARKLGIPASTLTGVIDRLEEKGWVCRERSQVDRRVVTIRLGPRYQEQKVVLQNHLTKDAYRLLADLSDNECRQLLEGLKRVEVLIRQKVELSPKTKFGEGGV